MIDFTGVKAITIPEGSVKKITRNGVTLWEKISFVNQIPISTDTNGSIYNGTGYKTGSRINSSGNVASIDNPSAPKAPFVTGFIPCKQGDIIRLKNCFIPGRNAPYEWGDQAANTNVFGGGHWGLRSGLYNSSKAKIEVFSWGDFYDLATNKVSDYEAVDGKITQFKIAYSGVIYIRLCLAPDGNPADAIVTINEPIE